jgi:4-hydroxybenzoate polyprenyltransferase
MVMKYLRASHLAPTLLVSALCFIFAKPLFTLTDTILISFTIFTGQLLVGWSNDLIDYESDLAQQRVEKPLVNGELGFNSLRLALFINLPICIAMSLIGPLGFRGGSLHLFCVGCGIAYNFYFKRTIASPLPYALAFAVLPAVPYLASNQSPIYWMSVAGALFGTSAHFANVLKDMESDRSLGIAGLPQRLGASVSLGISLLLLALTTLLISYYRQDLAIILILSWLIGTIVIIRNPIKYAFSIVMALAVLNVFAMAL